MVNGERRRQSVFTSMTAQKARCPSGKMADEKWRVLYVAELREIWGKRSQRQLRRKEHLANAIIIIFHQIFYWLYYLPSWVLLSSSSPFPQSPPPPPPPPTTAIKAFSFPATFAGCNFMLGSRVSFCYRCDNGGLPGSSARRSNC